MTPRSEPRRARGAAVLAGLLAVLVLALLVALSAMAVVIADQRAATAELRSRRLSLHADALREEAVLDLQAGWPSLRRDASAWTRCADTQTEPPCGDRVQNRYDARWIAHALHTGSAGAVQEQVHIVVPATADGLPAADAVALVVEAREAPADTGVLQHQALRLLAWLARAPTGPLAVAGAVTLGDRVSLVVGDAGVPASVWADGDAQWQAQAASCTASAFVRARGEDDPVCTHCRCAAADALSSAAAEGSDVFDRDGGQGRADVVWRLPDPLLAFVGLPLAEVGRLRPYAAQFADGAAPGADAADWIWVDGDCALAPGLRLGSPGRPVVLLVGGARLQLGAGAQLWGWVLLHGRTPARVDLGAGAAVHGALASAAALQVAGDGAVIHDAAVLEALRTSAHARYLAVPVAGSWRDW